MILVAMTNRKDYEKNQYEQEQPEKELFLSQKSDRAPRGSEAERAHIQKS